MDGFYCLHSKNFAKFTRSKSNWRIVTNVCLPRVSLSRREPSLHTSHDKRRTETTKYRTGEGHSTTLNLRLGPGSAKSRTETVSRVFIDTEKCRRSCSRWQWYRVSLPTQSPWVSFYVHISKRGVYIIIDLPRVNKSTVWRLFRIWKHDKVVLIPSSQVPYIFLFERFNLKYTLHVS